MLQTLDALIDEGHDLVHFWSELLGALRDLLLRRSVPDRMDLLDRSEEETLALESAASGLSLEDLARAFQIVADLEAPRRASSQARFLFEAALIRLASLGSVRPIEDWISALGLDGSLPRTAPRSNAPEKKNATEREPPRDVSHAVARP